MWFTLYDQAATGEGYTLQDSRPGEILGLVSKPCFVTKITQEVTGEKLLPSFIPRS